jgi:hypothetical protein
MTDTEKAEYDDVVRQLMAKCEQLAAENAALKANNASAHQTLRAIYADSTQPATVRVRAAQAALNVETPSLKSQPPAIDATCEEIEPLADVVARQRARCDRMQREDPQFQALRNSGYLLEGKGNGSGDDSND